MSRYNGPRVKVMRALGVDLPGLSRKTIERRPYAPGQHGQNRRRKVSDFGRQLKEKQKLRYNYGIGEKQMRRYVAAARASKMAAGDKLLELLERRLDNAVFRAGYAPTIPAARQLVNHGHITVNGRRVDIPSYSLRPGDVIRPRTRCLGLANALAAWEEGVRHFDSSMGGLGGCPFAPGASGNVITEDLVFMFESMGVSTGIDFERLLAARAVLIEGLPEEPIYGHTPMAGLPKGFRAAA